jgi:hypothetical protein
MLQLSCHNTVRRTNGQYIWPALELMLYYLHKLDTLKDAKILQHCTNTVRFSHRRLKEEVDFHNPRLWDYAIG